VSFFPTAVMVMVTVLEAGEAARGSPKEVAAIQLRASKAVGTTLIFMGMPSFQNMQCTFGSVQRAGKEYYGQGSDVINCNSRQEAKRRRENPEGG
jgi:hypothetical protein